MDLHSFVNKNIIICKLNKKITGLTTKFCLPIFMYVLVFFYATYIVMKIFLTVLYMYLCLYKRFIFSFALWKYVF